MEGLFACFLCPFGSFAMNKRPLVLISVYYRLLRLTFMAMPSQNEIYDIGTEILNLQCLNCSQTQLFCKSIIPEEIKSPGPVL